MGEESDDGVSTRNGSSKKSRNAATRNQREKAEKEERERQRAEAASKRKGRAERRRADGIQATILVKASEAHADTDSDPSEEIPLAARALANRPSVAAATTTAAAAAAAAEAIPAPAVPPSSQPAPDTPPAESAAAAASAKSKGGRPTHKKKGRNQYTKDRDGRDDESPARSQSRDVQDSHGSGSTKQAGNEGGKSHSKAKGALGSKVTLTEMKRRVTAMFDFISKTQVELAGETPPATASGADETRRSSKENGTPSSLPMITLNGAGAGGVSPKQLPESKEGDDTTKTAENGEKTVSPPREFKELTCVEMMDFLTRDLVHWQGQFAA